MSGIFSAWKIDGGRIPKSELRAMAEPMRRRGPDGVSVWSNAGVGMGRTLLATTPEAAAEKLPLNHEQSDLVITADARLDNREVLIPQLGLVDRTAVIGDGELILRSYLKWGEDCTTHLLGDFAFSIWDRRQQKMFCARDHLGMKQLLYTHVCKRLFACATDPEALLALEDVPRKINQARVLDCLTDHLESVDKTSTMFSNIFRLPPGHSMTVLPDAVKIKRYWTLSPPDELHLSSEEEYQDAFVDVFGQAVGARLRGGEIVGSMLSGGLDSGSVVASACEIRKSQSFGPLKTISAVDDTATQNNPETHTILAMARLEGIQPHLVNLKDMDRLAPGILRNLRNMGEPFDGSMNMIRAIYETARSNGLKVMLDGVGGDAAMDIGNYSKRLIRRGRLMRAWQEMKADDAFWGINTPRKETYFRMLISAFLPNRIRHWRGRLTSKNLEKELLHQVKFSKEFADKHSLYNRLEKFRTYGSYSTWQNAQQHAVRVCMHPNEVVARERYDRVAAEYGIETRDPFRDIRVVNFCASLPSAQKSKNGFPKYILRQAFASSFPTELKVRMGKEDLGWAFSQKIFDRAMTMSKHEKDELGATLAPYQSPQTETDMFSEDWFYLANWIAGQNDKS